MSKPEVSPAMKVEHFKPAIVYAIYIASTAEKVWQALTTAEFSRKYFSGLAVETELKVGGTFVVRMPDGSWLMAFSRENHTGVGFARSKDGLTFTQFATATSGVVPELALTTDGRIRLYVCSQGVVESHLSSDRGTTWTREGTVITTASVGRAIVCDPSYIVSDGIFILKTTDATTK